MYRVEIENENNTLFRVKSVGYEFTIDTKGEGISPVDTLLASLGSCMGVYIRKYCAGARLNLGQFKITVEAELSKDAPVCFKNIFVLIDLKDTILDERRGRALLEFIKNCPVHNTLKNNPSVEIKIINNG